MPQIDMRQPITWLMARADCGCVLVPRKFGAGAIHRFRCGSHGAAKDVTAIKPCLQKEKTMKKKAASKKIVKSVAKPAGKVVKKAAKKSGKK